MRSTRREALPSRVFRIHRSIENPAATERGPQGTVRRGGPDGTVPANAKGPLAHSVRVRSTKAPRSFPSLGGSAMTEISSALIERIRELAQAKTPLRAISRLTGVPTTSLKRLAVSNEIVLPTLAEACKQRSARPEYRVKLIEGNKAYWDRRGRAPAMEKLTDAERRILASARSRARWNDPEWRARQMEHMRSPEGAAARRRAGKAAWANPEVNARRVKNLRASWTPEKRAAEAARKRAFWDRKGRKLGGREGERLREKQRRETPEHIASVSPQHRAAAKARWSRRCHAERFIERGRS
jgi:hypothetical protein